MYKKDHSFSPESSDSDKENLLNSNKVLLKYISFIVSSNINYYNNSTNSNYKKNNYSSS